MYNLASEPVSVSNYYSEYVQTILRYKNQQQKGIFIRYYNVNVQLSSSASATSAVHDIHSDYIYDIYEYTPIWDVDEITDNSEDNPDSNGFAFHGISSITTHSIARPRIHDLVNFAYAPYTTDHIYRVKSISTMLNTRDAGLTLFKLELENAFNVSKIQNLRLSGSYVYSMVDNANILKIDYEQILLERDIIIQAMSALSFDQNSELFYYIHNGVKIAPLLANSTIFDFFVNSNHIRQYFGLNIDSSILVPYGSTNYQYTAPDSYYDFTSSRVISGDGVIIPSSVVSVIGYAFVSDQVAIQDCANLLNLFRG